MQVNNENSPNQITGTDGNLYRPDIKAEADLSSSNVIADQMVLKRQSDGKYNLPRVIMGQSNNILMFKILSIGVWDMDTNGTKQVAHGLGADFSKIRMVDVIIINDAEDTIYSFPYGFSVAGTVEVHGIIYSIDNTNITLTRKLNGFFDDVAFDSGVLDRGNITLWYLNA